jgi:predicted transcriptional regulator
MVGNDYQRIVDGIDYWRDRQPIDVTYLLFDLKEDKYGVASQMNVNELMVTLTNHGTEPITQGYNPQRFDNVFSVLYGLLQQEVERYRRRVLIDATSTTKEAYGATVTIALMFKFVRIYIVPPDERGWYVPSPTDHDFTAWFSKTRNIRGTPPQEIYLPGQRLKQPTRDEVTVLLKLLDHNGFSDALTSIIRWCGGDPKDPVVKNRFSRLVRRLEEKGLVEKRPVLKRKEVYLTRFGEILSNALKQTRTHDRPLRP